MTLEELKKKVVTITVHKNIVLGEDLHEDDLLEFLELQEEEACSDERLLISLLRKANKFRFANLQCVQANSTPKTLLI